MQVFTLSATNLIAGDWVCLVPTDATGLTVTKASIGLPNGGTVLGVVTNAYTAGATGITVVTSGTVGNNATALGAGVAAVAVLDRETGRAVRKQKPDGSEYVLGNVDTTGNITIATSASLATSPLHVYNVKAYGAKGDYDATTAVGTDDAPAFAAAIAAMSPAASSTGATLYIPPGNYRLRTSVHITRDMIVQGAGGGNWAATKIFPDRGVTGFVVDGPATAPDGGIGNYSVLRDFAILYFHVPPVWMPNTSYDDGIGTSGNAISYSSCRPTGTANIGIRGGRGVKLEDIK